MIRIYFDALLQRRYILRNWGAPGYSMRNQPRMPLLVLGRMEMPAEPADGGRMEMPAEPALV